MGLNDREIPTSLVSVSPRARDEAQLLYCNRLIQDVYDTASARGASYELRLWLKTFAEERDLVYRGSNNVIYDEPLDMSNLNAVVDIAEQLLKVVGVPFTRTTAHTDQPT